jgi:hypothetical protein
VNIACNFYQVVLLWVLCCQYVLPDQNYQIALPLAQALTSIAFHCPSPVQCLPNSPTNMTSLLGVSTWRTSIPSKDMSLPSLQCVIVIMCFHTLLILVDVVYLVLSLSFFEPWFDSLHHHLLQHRSTNLSKVTLSIFLHVLQGSPYILSTNSESVRPTEDHQPHHYGLPTQ